MANILDEQMKALDSKKQFVEEKEKDLNERAR